MRAGVAVAALMVLLSACAAPGPTAEPTVDHARAQQPRSRRLSRLRVQALPTTTPTVAPSTPARPPPPTTAATADSDRPTPPQHRRATATPTPTPTPTATPTVHGGRGWPGVPRCLLDHDRPAARMISRAGCCSTWRSIRRSARATSRDSLSSDVGCQRRLRRPRRRLPFRAAGRHRSVIARARPVSSLGFDSATVETPNGNVYDVLPAVKESIGRIPRDFGVGDSVGEVCGGFDPF